MSANDELETVASEEIAERSSTNGKRRKFIRGAAAAPVVLAVSGRSALACTTCPGVPKGLSPMAWLSAHPGGDERQCAQLSHTPGTNFLGKSPGGWKPNPNGKTFQWTWPKGVRPFSKIVSTNLVTYFCDENGNVTKKTSTSSKTYPVSFTSISNLSWNDPPPPSDSGWCTGTKLDWLDPNRSVTRILIDSPGSLESHVCCAYLNALKWRSSGYPLTPDQVKTLYQSHTLPGSTTILGPDDIMSFLDQTWS